MPNRAAAVVEFDVDLMRHDIAAKGWLPTDLARRAKVSDMAVSNFLRGRYQNPRTALKLARALGYRSVRRYLVVRPVEQEVV